MPQMTIQQALELARAHHRAGRLREAEAVFRQILTASADPLVFNDLGNLLADAQRWDEAISAYRSAIQLQPTFAQAFHNLATVFETLNRPDEAIHSYRNAIAQNPQLAAAHYNLGKILQDNQRFEEAIEEYRRAIQIQPDLFEAHGNLGNALKSVGRIDESIAAFSESLRLSPDHPETNRNLAGALLLSGDLPHGFSAYSRWRNLARLDSLPHPAWDGSDLNGRSILLYEQQGFGDVIQFIRYAPLVVAKGGRVTLACSKELSRLLQDAPGIGMLVPIDDPCPSADVRCSLFDLPRLFGTTIDTIPAAKRYLHADSALVQSWHQRLSDVHELKVGLCWAGRPTHADDRRRSLAFDQLSAFTHTPGARFISLQKGPRIESASVLDWNDELKDFAETAALIENLDLVITVDTAVAHLAGALGKPTWLMLPFDPDWRWFLGRSDSPWYPTMKLFRQSQNGDWQTLIAQVAQALLGFKP